MVCRKVARPQLTSSQEKAGPFWQRALPTTPRGLTAKAPSGWVHSGCFTPHPEWQQKAVGQKKKTTTALHAHTKTAPNPQGIPQHLIVSSVVEGACYLHPGSKAKMCNEPPATLQLPPAYPSSPQSISVLPSPQRQALENACISPGFQLRQSSPPVHLFFEEISFHYLPGSSALWGITGGQWKIHVLSQ